jgi:hypothetical protein
VCDTLVHLVGAEALNLRRFGVTPDHEVPARGADWPGFEAREATVRSSAGSTVVVEGGTARVAIKANVLAHPGHQPQHRAP